MRCTRMLYNTAISFPELKPTYAKVCICNSRGAPGGGGHSHNIRTYTRSHMRAGTHTLTVICISPLFFHPPTHSHTASCIVLFAVFPSQTVHTKACLYPGRFLGVCANKMLHTCMSSSGEIPGGMHAYRMHSYIHTYVVQQPPLIFDVSQQ